MAVAALVVAILALVVSGAAAWYARDAAKAQGQLATIEAARHASELAKRKRADLRVRVDPGGLDPRMLVVRNEGAATAANVDVALTARGPGETPSLLQSPFPIDLHPGDEASAVLSESMATATRLTVTLLWTDGTGDQTAALNVTIT